MIIKELDASFGKLENKKLTLKDGLNVIYAPNESGKSTWCAFIRAMLYGIDTSRRDRADLLSDKTKYRPWSGGAMEGTMRLSVRDRDIILQRTAQGQAPMRKLRAVYELSGEAVEDPSGEALTGAAEEVFSGTAFIGQAGVKVSPSVDLDRRISGIVTSGSEDTSYSEIAGRLGEWQRKIKYNRSGMLPEARRQLEDKKSQLDKLRAAGDELSRMSEEKRQLEKEESLLKAELAAGELMDRQKVRARIRQAEDSADRAEDRANAIRQELTTDGRTMTQEDLDRIRSGAAYFDAARKNVALSNDNLRHGIIELKSVEERMAKSPFAGKVPEYADSQVKAAAKLEDRLSFRGKYRWLLWLSGGLLILMLACFLIGSFLGISELVIPGILLGVILFLLALRNSSFKKQRDKIAGEFGFSDPARLQTAAKEYGELYEARKYAEARLTLLKSTFEVSVSKAAEAQGALYSDCKALFPSFKDFSQLTDLLRKAESRLSDLSKAEYDIDYYNRLYCALFESYEGDPEADEESPAVVPRQDVQRTKKLLEEVTYSLKRLTSDHDLALGSIRTMGDPAILSGETEALESRISQLEKKYGAITLALDTLREADNELRTRFSPVISGIAGRYMSRMTEGKYESLRFDRSLRAEATRNGDSVSRSVLSLSQGTADQLYLSLRLAMCSLMLPECPVILDDALTNFDDERMGKALDLLLELSETRQIILFSCHKREADYFADNPNVNIIR